MLYCLSILCTIEDETTLRKVVEMGIDEEFYQFHSWQPPSPSAMDIVIQPPIIHHVQPPASDLELVQGQAPNDQERICTSEGK